MESFHTGKMRSCLKSKDLEEGWRRTCRMNLECFCCVFPLLVEVCGHLLPPLEMITYCSNDTLGFSKGVSSAAQTHNFGWMRYLSIIKYIWPRIKVILCANPLLMDTHEADPLFEKFQPLRTHPHEWISPLWPAPYPPSSLSLILYKVGSTL